MICPGCRYNVPDGSPGCRVCGMNLEAYYARGVQPGQYVQNRGYTPDGRALPPLCQQKPGAGFLGVYVLIAGLFGFLTSFFGLAAAVIAAFYPAPALETFGAISILLSVILSLPVDIEAILFGRYCDRKRAPSKAAAVGSSFAKFDCLFKVVTLACAVAFVILTYFGIFEDMGFSFSDIERVLKELRDGLFSGEIDVGRYAGGLIRRLINFILPSA